MWNSISKCETIKLSLIITYLMIIKFVSYFSCSEARKLKLGENLRRARSKYVALKVFLTKTVCFWMNHLATSSSSEVKMESNQASSCSTLLWIWIFAIEEDKEVEPKDLS